MPKNKKTKKIFNWDHKKYFNRVKHIGYLP